LIQPEDSNIIRNNGSGPGGPSGGTPSNSLAGLAGGAIKTIGSGIGSLLPNNLTSPKAVSLSAPSGNSDVAATVQSNTSGVAVEEYPSNVFGQPASPANYFSNDEDTGDGKVQQLAAQEEAAAVIAAGAAGA
jgi:hypothetical protein